MNFLLCKNIFYICTIQCGILFYCCPVHHCIPEKAIQKVFINLFISVQCYSICSDNSGISCADVANFAISLLLLMIIPNI